MKKNALNRLVGLIVLVGALMRLFGHPQGNLILTIGLAIFLLLKLLRLFNPLVGRWRAIHFLDFLLILAAMTALVLRYQSYPYASVVFGLLLLAETLVSLRIRLNALVGSSNVSTGLRLIRNLLFTRSLR